MAKEARAIPTATSVDTPTTTSGVLCKVGGDVGVAENKCVH